METWRECMPNYEASSLGRVRRSTAGRKTHAGRLMAPSLLTVGYLKVSPTVNGRNKSCYVHDLVAAAFLGPKPMGAHVNHKDGDKTNNRPENLEYVSRKQNMEHAAGAGLMVRGAMHPQSKLTSASVACLRADQRAGLSYSKLAAKYGVSVATAYNAANGNTWSHVA